MRDFGFDLPFIGLVPKEFRKNLEHRRKVRAAATGSRSARAKFYEMCRRDPLFYINTFCWTYNPKDYPDQPLRPFITWAKEDEIILAILAGIRDQRDVAIPKSRQLGATWTCVAAYEYRWHFYQGQSFFVASRTEEYIDEKGKPKELFYKVDFIHKHQPSWFLPRTERKRNIITNLDNDSVISGGATVPDLGRGDTLTGLLCDEHASMDKAEEISAATRNATHSRVFNSTPKGRKGKGREFHIQAHNPANIIVRVHWSDHPDKVKLAYEVVDGRPVARVLEEQGEVDAYWNENQELIDRLRKRGYTIEGKLRSPYYDKQCDRASSEEEIRQEEDIDFLAEGSQYFASHMIDDMRSGPSQTITNPVVCGTLDFDADDLNDWEWIEDATGDWKIWCILDSLGRPPVDEYVVGGDIAAGLGGTHSSNSCLQVLNSRGEQVAEFASKVIRPDVLARLAVVVCRWFHNAWLNWEENGSSGSDFTSQIKSIGYQRVYRQDSEMQMTKRKTKKPGWRSSRTSKPKMMGKLRRAMQVGEVVIRSDVLVLELEEYVLDGGQVVHQGAQNETNQSAAGEEHGDRVIAMGIANLMREDRPRQRREKRTVNAPPGSIAYRKKERQRLEKAEKRW